VAERSYRKLKENRGTVTIKVEEVLQPIFVKGLLRKRETQIVFAVIADSWRWGNGQYTQRRITAAGLHRFTGISKGNVSRIWRELVGRNVIRTDEQGRASFNEHSETWVVPELGTPEAIRGSQNGNPKFPNREPKVPISGTETPLNPKTDTAIRDLKNNIKSNIKNKKSGAQKRRAPAHLSVHQVIVSSWINAFKEKYGTACLWDGKKGKLLKGLLQRLSSCSNPVDEITRRARFCLDHAGDPKTALRHLNPPVTFPDFVVNWDRCIDVARGNGGYDAASYFKEEDRGKVQ